MVFRLSRCFERGAVVTLLAVTACGGVVVVDSGDESPMPEFDGVAIEFPSTVDPGTMDLEVHVGAPAPACGDVHRGSVGSIGFGHSVIVALLPAKYQHAGAGFELAPGTYGGVVVGVGAKPNVQTGGALTSGALRVVDANEHEVTIELSGIGTFPPTNDHPKFTIDVDGTYTARRCPQPMP